MDGGRGRGRPRGARGPLRRPRRAVRARRRAPPPPAQRPRRHRAHAAAGRRDRGLRGDARAPRSRHAESVGSHNYAQRSSPCPATGSAPRWSPPPSRCCNAVAADLDYEEHPFGGAAIDAHGTALTDETLAACQARRRRPARRRRRPEVGHHRPGAAAPRAGPARPAQGARPVRQPAPGPAAARALRRQPAQARADRGHRPARRARAHRRDLLRRARAATDGRASDIVRLHRRRRSSGSPASRFQAAALARDERRQGQRARDVPAVARGRHPRARRGVPERRARAPARRHRRDAARRRARATST